MRSGETVVGSVEYAGFGLRVLPTVGIAWLADHGGAFDFWRDEGEAIYSPEDGEPL